MAGTPAPQAATTLSWIDSHTHLEHDYPFSVDEYLQKSRAAGIQKFITIGTRPESLEKLKDFSEKYPDVFFTVGIHPHETKDYNDSVEATMRTLQAHPKCVGIGEIGLDYYYNHSTEEQQRAALDRQLKLAIDCKKPVVIHARDAEAHLLEALARYTQATSLKTRPGVIHCFSGSAHFATECVKLGFYISFSGILTFKKADDLRAIAKHVPEDRILLETDSPFLAPVPYRGKPNHSAYLVETAKVLGQTLGIPLEKLSKLTVSNTETLFGLSSH